MTARVWREGPRVRKRTTDRESARRLLRWTSSLRAAGVATPEVSLDPAEEVLVFPAIEGTGGLALVMAEGPPVLAELLRPLLVLHRASLNGLVPFDPLRKILPRLGAENLLALKQEASEQLAAIPEPSGGVPVHGDFHAGQVMRDAGGTIWLLDLEDLAAGAPESDLGNFAAHLATRPETRCGPVRQGLEHWLTHTLGAYRVIGGEADGGLAERHGRVALIRRALKLRERGDASVLGELLAR